MDAHVPDGDACLEVAGQFAGDAADNPVLSIVCLQEPPDEYKKE
jgi:hypothetical protein